MEGRTFVAIKKNVTVADGDEIERGQAVNVCDVLLVVSIEHAVGYSLNFAAFLAAVRHNFSIELRNILCGQKDHLFASALIVSACLA